MLALAEVVCKPLTSPESAQASSCAFRAPRLPWQAMHRYESSCEGLEPGRKLEPHGSRAPLKRRGAKRSPPKAPASGNRSEAPRVVRLRPAKSRPCAVYEALYGAPASSVKSSPSRSSVSTSSQLSSRALGSRSPYRRHAARPNSDRGPRDRASAPRASPRAPHARPRAAPRSPRTPAPRGARAAAGAQGLHPAGGKALRDSYFQGHAFRKAAKKKPSVSNICGQT